jgi:HK97 family phage prohead protease
MNEDLDFESIEQKSYSDYPEAVRNNAKRVLKYVEENGWGPCGTDVGKQRANQLAKGEPVSVDTIKRMYSYLSRHEVDLQSSSSYDDGCGLLMYDAWGGKAALSWSRSKLRELGEIKEQSNMSFLTKGINQGFQDADMKQGIVSGYFAMFGNKDLDGDVIERGAFTKTIQERGPNGKKLIKYLLDHDSKKSVALITNLEEDMKGLRYEAKIGTHSLGVDFMKMVESGLINQHSFGFSVPKDKQYFDGTKKANVIKEVIMYEGSAVQFLGANPETTFIDLKSETDAFEYLDRLEKFVRTSDATDETLVKLEERLKSLYEILKPKEITLEQVKADLDSNKLIESLKSTFRNHGRIAN